MKRKNSWFTALFVSIILLAITGCKNSSQIMFENLGDNDANKNGLSAVVISIGEKVERNIVPEEWTEQKKSTLLYEITSDSTPEGATVTVGDVFTWDEIVEKKAVVYLDPKDWTLTLTAYQQLDTDKFKAKDVSGATEVLKATGVEAKLTTGAKKITFNLKPVTTGTEAVGDVNIQIKFFNEKDIGLNNVEFKILNGSTNVLTTNPPTGTPEKTSFLIGDLSVIGNRGLTSALLAGKVKAGRY